MKSWRNNRLDAEFALAPARDVSRGRGAPVPVGVVSDQKPIELIGDLLLR